MTIPSDLRFALRSLGRAPVFTVAAVASLALGMTTAAILIETGADLGGYSWWQVGGSYFDMYAQQGKIMLIP